MSQNGYSVIDISNYILKCTDKIEKHKNNAINASVWNNFLSTASIVLSAGTALSLSILTVLESDVITITVVSSIYAFLITIANKVKDSYSFLALSYQHYHLLDQFAEIQIEMQKAYDLNDVDQFPILIYRFILIEQKSHIQNVKCSNCMRCCLRS